MTIHCSREYVDISKQKNKTHNNGKKALAACWQKAINRMLTVDFSTIDH
jgi:hypothetical protein